jgi:hypothetical protein
MQVEWMGRQADQMRAMARGQRHGGRKAMFEAGILRDMHHNCLH